MTDLKMEKLRTWSELLVYNVTRKVTSKTTSQTGNISPKFNLVFDDYYDTVHAEKDQEPPIWSELITFQYFNIAYDDYQYVSNLDDEWLDPEYLLSRRHQESQRHPKIPVK